MPVKKGKGCVADVMREWKSGNLHSGKNGDVVKDKDQAVAIALSMCGKSKSGKDKSYGERAKELLNEVKRDSAGTDMKERPRGRLTDTAFMPGEQPVLSARFKQGCGCSHKEGTSDYANCNCGCPNCKKRVGSASMTFSEEDTQMSLAQLRKLRADASFLIGRIEAEMMAGNEVEFESWMEAKITLACDYMSSVIDFVMFGPGLEVEEEEQENEGYSDNDRMTSLKLFGFKEGKR